MESCFGFIAVNILIAEDSSERVYHSKSFLDDREIVEYEPCAFFLCVTPFVRAFGQQVSASGEQFNLRVAIGEGLGSVSRIESGRLASADSALVFLGMFLAVCLARLDSGGLFFTVLGLEFPLLFLRLSLGLEAQFLDGFTTTPDDMETVYDNRCVCGRWHTCCLKSPS